MSASTRLPSVDDKIEFSCTCGKRYRVPSSKAGKKVRCKNCRLKVQVPGEAQISVRTRKAILEELGIDADESERGHAEEASTYRCNLCSTKMTSDEASNGYGGGELVCATCRASFGGEPDAAEPGAEGEKKKKKKKKGLDDWSSQGTKEGAQRKAIAYGLLFFVGIAGFVQSIFAPGWLVTIAVAGAAAGLGARSVYKTYEPAPQPKKKPA